MAKSAIRERLEALNEECERFCRGYRGTKWKPFGDPANQKHPNFRLLYSSPETFEVPGKVMIVGTNPGGTPAAARVHDSEVPFNGPPRYSAYLDDEWSGRTKGQHPTQLAVRRVATLLAGKPNLGDRLLKGAPTGNLIPYRSPTSEKRHLPQSVRDRGFEIGGALIDIARPRVLIWIASNNWGWDWIMEHVGHDAEPDYGFSIPDRSRRYLFREANTGFQDAWPTFVFALPALNNSDRRLRDLQEAVLNHFEERVRYHGLAAR